MGSVWVLLGLILCYFCRMNFKEVIEQNDVFNNIRKAVSELGLEAYVIGGFVRDLILKRPSKDVDVVCVGSGIELAQKVADQFTEEVNVHFFKNFGTAQIKTAEFEIEFVGARKESYSRDSRKPVVEDGTLEDDQNRRDFTINALAISLKEETLGDLVDPFGGIAHLKSKTIITPLAPDETFSDDPLRMMRAIRFAAQLQFDIDPDTFESIQRNAKRIEIVSAERIAVELNKIILANKPSYGFNLLFQCGLLAEIFPEMVALHGVETKDGKSHKDNFYHTLQVLDNISKHTDDLWWRWSAILHDIAKPPTKRFHKKAGWTFHGHEDKGARMVPSIFRRMKLPMNENMRFVQKMVRLHLRPIALVKEHVTDSAIRRLLFETGDDIDALMTLCRADITSKNGDKIKKYLKNFDVVEEKLKKVEEEDKMRNFQPVVTGEMVMLTFGLSPSKEVGEIKAQVREAILDGKIKNILPEARDYMIEIGKGLGLELVAE